MFVFLFIGCPKPLGQCLGHQGHSNVYGKRKEETDTCALLLDTTGRSHCLSTAWFRRQPQAGMGGTSPSSPRRLCFCSLRPLLQLQPPHVHHPPPLHTTLISPGHHPPCPSTWKLVRLGPAPVPATLWAAPPPGCLSFSNCLQN